MTPEERKQLWEKERSHLFLINNPPKRPIEKHVPLTPGQQLARKLEYRKHDIRRAARRVFEKDVEQNSVELPLIGYWSKLNGFDDGFPTPYDFTGDWPGSDKVKIVNYLTLAPKVMHYDGWSWCRFCNKDNGGVELSDGTFMWPRGYAHYIEKHNVLIPQPVLQHIRDNNYLVPNIDYLKMRFVDPTDRNKPYEDKWMTDFEWKIKPSLKFWKEYTRPAQP